MKILIVSCSYYPEIGAAPVRITNMAEGLKEMGCQVDVLSCMPNYPKARIFDAYKGKAFLHEQISGVDIYRYIHYPSNSTKLFPRAISMVSFGIMLWLFGFRIKKICSYDRVIIQTPPIISAWSAMILLKGLYRRKTILNISDLWPLSAVELGAVRAGSRMHKILCWIEKSLYRHADAICGQSQEILDHVQSICGNKPSFLYRNLQKVAVSIPTVEKFPRTDGFQIVYAGLLGIAQDILSIIRQINFKQLDCQFHLYGAGNQAEEIADYLKEHPDSNVSLHGTLPKKELSVILPRYHASIVPLTTTIRGAVPSKIFDLIAARVPILFCGGGEGAQIVEKYGVGLTSAPSDYSSLMKNIKILSGMSSEEYAQMISQETDACNGDFSFDKQMQRLRAFLSDLDKKCSL